MAAVDQLQNLQDEATCSICLGYFKDPVTVDCGHNFCRSCITECWEGSDPNCPQCREPSEGRNLRPNRQLVNVVDIARQLQENNLCQKHQQRLQLFCQEDKTPICLVCNLSAVHKKHCVIPIEEASQEYKNILQKCLKKLNTQLKDVQGWTTEEKRTASELEHKFQSLRERIVGVFEELNQFLEQEKPRLLNNMAKDQEEATKNIQGKLAELEKQQYSLSNLITEIEGKCQQQDVEFLKDVQSFVNRSDNEKIQKPKDDSAAMKKTLQILDAHHAFLQGKTRELKDKVPQKRSSKKVKTLGFLFVCVICLLLLYRAP